MSKVAVKGKGVNCSPWPVVGVQEVLSLNCSKGNKCRKNFLTSDCQRSGAVEQMVWDGLGVSIVAILKCRLAKLHFRELSLF